MITAKVVCSSKVESGEGDSRRVTVAFSPDYADGRNKEWALYTPGLSLTMGLRGSVADRFEVGQAFELRFVPEGDEEE